MEEKKVFSIDMGGGKSSSVILQDISPTLTCTHYGEPAVYYEDGLDADCIAKQSK